MLYKISEGQSVLDVAVQKCGAAEAALALAIRNEVSITEELSIGKEIVLSEVVNKNIAAYYANKNLSPATGITTNGELLDEGIEFWAIEYDFVVS
jgi:hypothetical protein